MAKETEKIKPLFAVTADWHLGKRQYGLKHREQDRYNAVWGMLEEAAGAGVEFILNGGDTLDITRPTSRAVNELFRMHGFLSERNIPMYLVQGNHDRTDPPWFDLFADDSPGGVKMLEDGVVVRNGVRVHGVGERPRNELRGILEKAPDRENETKTVLLTHISVEEWIDFYGGGNAFSLENDLPRGKYDLAVIGDTHVTDVREVGGTVCVSPGSAEIGDKGEPWDKYWLLFDKDLNHGFRTFGTRCAERVTAMEKESADAAVKRIGELDKKGATVYLRYNVSVDGLWERALAAAKNSETHIVPEPSEPAEEEGMEKNAESVTNLTPSQFVGDLTNSEIAAEGARKLLETDDDTSAVVDSVAEAVFREEEQSGETNDNPNPAGA